VCAKTPIGRLLKPFLEQRPEALARRASAAYGYLHPEKSHQTFEDYPAIRDWLLPVKERLENGQQARMVPASQAAGGVCRAFQQAEISIRIFNAARKLRGRTRQARYQ